MAAVQVQASPASRRADAAVRQMRAGVQAMSALIREGDIETLGVALIQIRERGVDPLEAVSGVGLRRLAKSGEGHADGAVSVVDWLRSSCRLSVGAAAERVGIARQLEKLPQTEAAFASGALGYQHVVVMARAAEHVGATAVRKEEASLLQAAQTMDPGRFTGVAKNFEHRVDAAGALAEANRAYQRRYLHLGEPQDGLVRLDGLLDTEGGATLRTALQAFMKPIKDDARSYGQRCADAVVELARQGSGASKRDGAGGKGDGAGPRPQRVIRARLDTLAGTRGAPAGELEGGGTVPAGPVQRYARHSATRPITGPGPPAPELSPAPPTSPAPPPRA